MNLNHIQVSRFLCYTKSNLGGTLMKTISYSNRLYLSKEESDCLMKDIQLYHSMLIHSYRLLYHMNYHDLKVKSLQAKVKSFYGTRDYLPLSAIHEAKALFKSTLVSHKNHFKKVEKRIQNIKKKIVQKENEIMKLENQHQHLITKTKEGKQSKVDYHYEHQVLKPQLRTCKSQLGLFKFRLHRELEYHNSLKKRVRMVKFKEPTSMTIPGRRQGKYSNNLFKYQVDEGIMVYRSTTKDIRFSIQFHQDHDILESRIRMKHNTPGKAVAYQLVHHDEYFIIKAIFDVDEPILHTSKQAGCVGVDINRNHLALTEINKEGNIVYTKNYPIQGVDAKQRKHSLQGMIKEIVEECAIKQKDLVLEELDFEEMKSRSTYKSKQRNRMLSEFAYSQITETIQRKGQRCGVRVEKVNPAYTSVLAKIKMTRQRGLSIHQGAAMAIARRGMGYSENIPNELQCFASTWKEVNQVFKVSKHNEHPLLALI